MSDLRPPEISNIPQCFGFDRVIREGLSTKKWEYEIERTQNPDLLCFGTADMDFYSPKPVLDALQERIRRGHLGYIHIIDDFYLSVENWLEKLSGWKVHAKDCVSHNVGIYTEAWNVLDALTEPGDEIIIQTPVHFCFNQIIRDNDRVTVMNPLKRKNGSYVIDFDHLESCFTDKTRIFWLCNPHNPVGRAWTGDELLKVGEICLKRRVTILSDDVYCGLLYPGILYTPIASLSGELSDITVTCYSGSKTYNITGLRFSFVVIENPVLMTAYRKSLQKLDLEYGVNALGVTATIAAFNECDEWRRALMLYIRDNHQLTRQFSADYMPDVLIANADSTYFAWMDFRRLGMDVTKFVQILEQEAGLIVENGSSLGIGGEGFIRLNIACPRQVLEQGLNRIKEIYEKYHG